MHQSYTTANGANMPHQQASFTPVPLSQQQQSSGQANHNQQTAGVAQRHHQNFGTYSTQAAQARPQQPGSGHPNQQGPRMIQFNQQGTNQHTGAPNYIPGHPQGQQGYGLQHVTQLPARPAGPPATAYYNVPPGAQPIMTIHSPNFAMFPQNGPRQQLPAQQYFHPNQQMAISGHNQATMAAVAAAQGQTQQQPQQVLYNYPPTLYPAFHQQHITGPPPMMTTPGQPPQIPGMHPAQPPPQGAQPGQSGQAVQTQVSTGGGQQTMTQHIQQNPASHPSGGPQQVQQPAPAHPPQGVSRPQPTPTPPILIQSGPAQQTHSVQHQGTTSIINHPMGPPPQGLPVHEQSTQQSAPAALPFGRTTHHKPYNEPKRPRKGIAIIDPETRKEVVVTKSGNSNAVTDADAQKDLTASVEKDLVHDPMQTSKDIKHGEDPVKQTIIAEFQSKVIQAKAEGNESESSMKKKTLDEISNTDPSDNGESSSQFQEASVIHSETSRPLSGKVVNEDVNTESTVNKDKAIVSDETKKVASSTQLKTDTPSSQIKITGDIHQQGKILEHVPRSHDETHPVQNAVKESLAIKASLNQKLPVDDTKNNTEYRPPLSTPKQSSDPVNELDPVSPTPLPETPKSGATTPSFAAVINSATSTAKADHDVAAKSENLSNSTTLPRSDNTPESFSKGNSKNISGKAKRDVLNNKKIENELDAYEETNSNNLIRSNANDSLLHNLTSTDIESDKTLFSDAPKNLETIESQSKNIDKQADLDPSTEENSCNDINNAPFTTDMALNSGYDGKLDTKASMVDSVKNSDNAELDANHRRQNSDGTLDSTLKPSLGGIELPVVENGILEKGPTLKYEYKPDQWSPINIEGKKQYDREFLMKLQQDPLSMTKPDNLPNMDIIKDKAIAKISSGIPGADKMFTPSFVKPTISNRGPPARGASRGKKEQRPGQQGSGQHQRVLVLPEVNKPVVLHEAENAWKPRKYDENGEDDEIAILERKARSILNKLTPQKFDKLVAQFKELDIDTVEKLEMCMELVFEKALDEPEFSVAYAKMCEVLKDKAPSTQSEEDPKKALNFKRILIAKCQREFYRDYMEDLNKDKYESDLAAAESEDKRKEVHSEWEQQERKARKRSLGNIRFIGELYKLKMLTVRIMHECVNKLLIPNHAESLEAREESLECLCKLLTTVGKDLDEETSRKINDASKNSQAKPQDGIKKLDVYFTEMANVIEGKQTSSRIRFRIQDLIDLRRRRWVPRRESDGPKKIDAIHADIAREKTLQALHDHNVGNIGGGVGSRDGSKNIGRDRDGRGNVGDPRKRSSRGPQGQVGVPTDHEGWNTVPSRPPTKVQEKFDPSKISGLTVMHKKDPDTALGMRPMSMSSFSAWGKGSGGSNRMSQSKEDRNSPMPRNQNRFSSLYNPPGERSVSPSAQPLSSNFDRQGSSGSQSPTSTLERQHRAGSSGSRSMGPIVRDFRGPNRGPNDTTNEREGTLHAVHMHTHMQGNNVGPFIPANFVKMSSNGPPGVATISRQPSNIPSRCRLNGPSEDDIKQGQQRMQGQQARKSELDLERCINNVLEEYLNSCDDKEVASTISESFNRDVMPQCVEVWINHAMEHRDNKCRTTLAKLLVHLVNERLLQRAQCLEGFSKFLPTAIELKCDIPKIWDYIGEVVATMLESKVFGMEFLSETAKFICQNNEHSSAEETVGPYIVAVLKILSQKVGEPEAGKMWNEAQLRWDMFPAIKEIDKFLDKHKLGFTLNERPGHSTSIDQLADDLKRLLKNSKPADNNEIIQSIDQYLANTAKSSTGEPDNQFIRILTTEVAESTIAGIGNHEQPNNRTLETDAMQHRAVILKRYLDAKVERETQALFALQALVHKLEHPNKLLHQIFECLYQADVITYEGFEQWEQSKDPAEQEGKGVAIKSTTQFFTWLREVDPDEET